MNTIAQLVKRLSRLERRLDRHAAILTGAPAKRRKRRSTKAKAKARTPRTKRGADSLAPTPRRRMPLDVAPATASA